MTGATAPAPRDPLLEGFRSPPPAARPRVWWHWMNGNVTEDGIRRDLEWMKRIGIGGVDAIDAAIATPQVVPRRLIYMSPAWKHAFRYATRLADRFGLELSIDSSPGWSETGGPWVLPQQGMKKLVWTATGIDGGKPFHGVLRRPPDTIGPFGNAPMAGDIAPSPAAERLRFYRDSIVIAYRAPVPAPRVTEAVSSAGPLDAALLSDGDLTRSVSLAPQSEDGDAWIRVRFDRPATIQGLSLALATTRGLGFVAVVEASDDGLAWRHVADMRQAAQLQRLVLVQQTVSFAPAMGRFFRVVVRPAPPLPTSLRPRDPAPGLIEAAPSADAPHRAYRLYELVLHAAATVNAFEQKAQFAAPPRDFYALATAAPAAPDSAIDPGTVVVLTDRMKADGTLDWMPPPGRWTVLRLGYSLTGSENHPATAEATGLEVDKLDRTHVRAYLEHYLDTYRAATGPALFGRRGLQSLVVDSAETGMQNWTADMLADFRRLRGYDPVPWLPALTGAVVRSPADSDRFLWDFRRTAAELLSRNHYGEIAAVARERGLATYMEAIEDHRPTFGDDLDMRRYADVPMAAMWTYGERFPSALTYEADILGAASVAHVYGRNLVAAESLTSANRPWAFAPRELKPLIDMEFVRGVNRVVIHASVHQPVDRPPGLSLSGYGQFFNRLESWSGQAGAWMRYIARCSFLLQQGRAVADIAYFTGQEAPVTGLFGDTPVDVPAGYGFDFVDADALDGQLSVDRGDLATGSGMRYHVLYLGGSSRMMTLPVLRRIRDLVAQGAVLVGRRPVASPSLADEPGQFAAAASDLFGSADAPHRYGRGQVFPAGSLPEALATRHLPPDFAFVGSDADSRVLYAHRRLAGGDLYFVSNRLARAQTVAAAFRTADGVPEIWDAVSGAVSLVDFSRADGLTKMTLSLPPNGSAFVVFRKNSEAQREVAATEPTLLALDGPWKIAFQPGRGAPPVLLQRALQSWSDSTIPGIKYFSGTAVYSTTFDLPASAFAPGTRLELDLGEVRELADVTLNGHAFATVWTPPFRVDTTKAARPGRNVLTVTVANLWVNRLIGDAQPGVTRPVAFTAIPTYRADAPLRPSGLLGPVVIRQSAR
ncbi:MAG: glycosyl hydrolase [Rhizomicrobium sp.]